MFKVKKLILTFFVLHGLVPICLSGINKKKESLHNRTALLNWSDICKNKKNSVVQIFSYCNGYDLFDPHHLPEQGVKAGTGSFVSGDGFIVSNFHVVDSAVGIYAQTSLTGKERFELQFVGGCPLKDTVLLKLTPEALARFKDISQREETPFVEFGNSDEVIEAQPIMLLGHPGAEEEVKITVGFVKGRTIGLGASLIQTTAPSNPGDSGGPFFNDRGQVIGICVAKKIGSECFGYIIPSNTITLILDDLLKNKILRPPFWGVSVIPASASTRAYLKCPEEGVYVADVMKGSLGAKAGIEKGDIIVAIDDRKLDQSGFLFVDWTDEKVLFIDYMNRISINSSVKISFYRDGKLNHVTSVAQVKKPEHVDLFYPVFEPLPEYEIFAGMVISQLTLNHILFMQQVGVPLERGLLKYAQDDEILEPCLIITSIFNTSKAHLSRAFSRRIMLLKKVNGKEVTTIKEFRDAIIAGKNDEYVTFEADSGAFVALPLKEIIQEDTRLSNLYGYKSSSLFDCLK